MQNDLSKLLDEWREARLKYPNVRRAIEDRFFSALVLKFDERPAPAAVADEDAWAVIATLKARVAEMEAEMQRRKGGRPRAEAA